MSEKQEKKRRYNIKLAYISAFERWLQKEPPYILFWRWRRWKQERPDFFTFLKGGKRT